MGEHPAIEATPEQWRQLYHILIDPATQQVAGKLFAIPDLKHFVEEIIELYPEME